MTIKLTTKRDPLRVRCTAEIPNDRGGDDKHIFYVKFDVPDSDTREKLVEDARANDLDFDEVLPQYIKGWDKINDEDDKALEFNDDNLERVLQDIFLRDAITIAFTDLLFERTQLRRKNSSRPAARG